MIVRKNFTSHTDSVSFFSSSRVISIATISETLTKRTAKGNENDLESKRMMLIMVLWTSVVFTSSRLVFSVDQFLFFRNSSSPYSIWASVLNFFYSSCVYISYLFVYLKTNKLFRRKFYKIFFRNNSVT